MDQEWSEKNKEMQRLLSKEATFRDGIGLLLSLRESIFDQITQIFHGYPKEAFYQMPYKNADGYHSKTLSYSVWHIFRIEDIVAHELIARDEQILFRNGTVGRIRSPIITTGNELSGDEIGSFSERLDIPQLYLYARDVMESTNDILCALEYRDLKRTFDDSFRDRLKATKCISEAESASWLIDYWCGKDVKGLIQMPFSRHWIMHVEAMRRIRDKLCKEARKGIDPVAYCGSSCNHCFPAKRCGSCRTGYNACSFAVSSPDGICPNTACCTEKGYDGCRECPEIMRCEKGFYTAGNDGASAAKAQALYIRKYGEKAFLKLHDRLFEKYDLAKTQEIPGRDTPEGLRIPEES